MKRKLAAILYADVAGYSRWVGADEEGTHCVLKTRLEAISEAVVVSQGRVCHFAGDAVLAEFASITAALECAVRLQRCFADLDKERPKERKLRFRMGVNLGEVIVDGEEIYGNGVNVAARLEALAEPGGVCISGRVLEQVEGKCDIGFSYIGRQRVKNIDKPVNVYRILLDPRYSGKIIGETSAVGSSWKPAALAALIVIAMAFLGAVAWLRLSQPGLEKRRAGDPAPLSLVDTPVVAVLPFANTSSDPEQDYFAEAITEDLAGAIGRFPEFGVIASESLIGVNDTEATPREIHRKFGVSYLLAGSVRRDGNAVRLVARLICNSSDLI